MRHPDGGYGYRTRVRELRRDKDVKRWKVEHTPKGMALGVTLARQLFLGNPPTTISSSRPDIDWFFCDATDELSALARFMEAWKEQAK